jgi:hypothetical protein
MMHILCNIWCNLASLLVLPCIFHNTAVLFETEVISYGMKLQISTATSLDNLFEGEKHRSSFHKCEFRWWFRDALDVCVEQHPVCAPVNVRFTAREEHLAAGNAQPPFEEVRHRPLSYEHEHDGLLGEHVRPEKCHLVGLVAVFQLLDGVDADRFLAPESHDVQVFTLLEEVAVVDTPDMRACALCDDIRTVEVFWHRGIRGHHKAQKDEDEQETKSHDITPG